MQQGSTMSRTVRGFSLALALSLVLGGCASVSAGSGGGSASPSSSPSSPTAKKPASPTETARPVSGADAERLKRVMVPLLQAMNHPLPPSKVKIGIMDDEHINAASAGGGEF